MPIFIKKHTDLDECSLNLDTFKISSLIDIAFLKIVSFVFFFFLLHHIIELKLLINKNY